MSFGKRDATSARNTLDLSLKYRGNAHEREIVTTTRHEPVSDSSSGMPKNFADLTATTISFPAKNAVDQFDHIMAIQ
jgi:hypothetical protein